METLSCLYNHTDFSSDTGILQSICRWVHSEAETPLCKAVGRIHGCDGPVSDADRQEEKGDDRVEESRHDVADGP